MELDRDIENFIIKNFDSIPNYQKLKINLDDSDIGWKVYNFLESYFDVKTCPKFINPVEYKFSIHNVFGCFPISYCSHRFGKSLSECHFVTHYDFIDFDIDPKLFGIYEVNENIIPSNFPFIKEYSKKKTKDELDFLSEVIDSTTDLINILF